MLASKTVTITFTSREKTITFERRAKSGQPLEVSCTDAP